MAYSSSYVYCALLFSFSPFLLIRVCYGMTQVFCNRYMQAPCDELNNYSISVVVVVVHFLGIRYYWWYVCPSARASISAPVFVGAVQYIR